MTQFTDTKFTSLGLAQPILKALAAEGYETPTPIQAQAIPSVLAGKDLLGIAQTGTGKTAAFALPILHRLAEDRRPSPRRGARCVVLSPTRELATQIAESFRRYGKHLNMSVAVIFGGAKYGPQIKALAGGLDILVATPGRLLDHIAERNADLSTTEILVLDEADQMLDLGFLQPIRKIIGRMSRQRQNLFFSATMPTEIGKLAGEMLVDPAQVTVTPVASTVERINQRLLFVEAPRKRALLAELMEEENIRRAIVFTRTKRGADRVAQYLDKAGITAAAIHGDKSQGQRERALAAFKKGEVRAMVATDIAARGIDIDGVSHVIQYELPQVPEAYVHRIGRTARAGAEGAAIAFCADDERNLLRDIQRLIKLTIPSFDRRNDKGLALMAAATASLPAAEQALPQKKDRPARPPRRRGGGGQRSPRDGEGRPQGQGQGAARQDQGAGRKRNNGPSGRPAGRAPAQKPKWSPLEG
ncbi:RNA helicase [Caulobacter sp. CCUG 60055]|uniref:DEAD/DEAH box helicase n=1 Tax=Caulobacter sp. CCUG 60055 TaxID=2100090 RepID=UPI001FA76157|nr:DEAD/DEAH box helicase [Caulobacteraceae bacterium]MCI3181579.1 RNA helicase [Caulobacter sp. CCUG 60055]